jgi:PAS domain S-box-containing protein
MVRTPATDPYATTIAVNESQMREAAEQFEADLQAAEDRNRTFVEELPLVTYIEHLDEASASYISPQIEMLVGYTPEQWTSDPDFFASVLHEDDRERVISSFAAMHATGERHDCEYRLIARDGRTVWIHDGAVVVRDEDGRHRYAQGFMLDISDRKQAELSLQESEQRFRDLVSGIDVIVWEADPELNFSFVSKRAEDILGYPVEDWLRVPGFVLTHVHPEDRDRVVQADRAAVTNGQDYELSYRVIAADGRVVPFREVVRVEIGEDGRASRLRGVMIDVTVQEQAEAARVALEDQLQQAQKMEAIGRLAGGIAHDFNNLLTAILGYSDLALLRLEGGDEAVRADLGEIQAASKRAATLTHQLLAFTRQQAMVPVVLDVNDALKKVAKLLHRLIGEEIAIETIFASEPLFVEADPTQLEQVVINLAINARDAMPKGGMITMTCARCDLDEAAAGVLPNAVPGVFACISVADTGHGISPEAKPYVFDPFFTTKEVGKGTGLGLATAYGTVQQSDGFMTVNSEPGEGATFTVYLPLSMRSAPDDSLEPDDEKAKGTETILLVEDEQIVRDLTQETLELGGYRVLAAPDAATAIALSRDHPYDLLLTDVVMPVMRGGELAQRLSLERPGLKVLFMSGYLDGEAALGEGLNAQTAFLQKPFTLADLTLNVRQLLDS